MKAKPHIRLVRSYAFGHLWGVFYPRYARNPVALSKTFSGLEKSRVFFYQPVRP